ncbi:right-handed parallel beta-helix repeat-containing protein [Planococcus salinus]|uniref:Right-handed parallel beta-helix repeat-containing protein n=1 Tax=Planococcus salinus TaxID=1848460 RepID=A0A3M8P777_9BACL|nr:right-handed parallel beta-helix repeat-containing protein [Planococcus salinus]RNF39527.1 right-handed parallel beta-helix repeat-containing protein [Planococcus salinus]
MIGVIGISYMLLINNNLLWGDDEVNVKTNYDAQGDGMTDDTEEIQAAIDETPVGGTLKIPPGVYKVSKNPQHKAVTGYGESFFALKVRKPMTIEMEEATFLTDTDEEYGVFWIHNTSDVHLTGGFLMGEYVPEASLTSHIGVLLQNTNNSLVENLYTKNFSQGIHLHHSNYNTVRKVTSENNYGSGIINFASDYNLIDSCVVRNSGDGHLSLYGGGEYNHVINCVVTEDRPEKADQQGITVESERNSLIEKNTVSGFYYGIDVKNGAEANVIKANNAFNNEYNIAVRPGDGGKNLRTPSHDIEILNNLALNPRGNSHFGIYIGVGEGHVIEGNTLNKNHLVISDEGLLNQYSDKNFYE